jgi:hypothetical protein
MAQRESKLSRHIMEGLRREGWFCFKIHGGPTMMAGLPDVIVCAEGVFVGLETKNPESRSNVSLRQKITHQQIRDVGHGYVAVVCTVGEAVDAVREAIFVARARLAELSEEAG